ncbi:MAG TPA: cellulose binding domain-containing protein, partial [Euzebyales bacterium]|nr:cellulose binding domain-containing protein [Euzebyales bacterium]
MRRRGRLGVCATMVALLAAALSAVPVAAPAAAQAPGCTVDYAVTSQWPGGFTANVVVTATGAAVDGWMLTWEFPDGQQIAQIWNADVNDAGPAASVSNASWNAVIPAGGSASFGFNGSWAGGNGVPGAFALNGVSCGDEAPDPDPDPGPDPDPDPEPDPGPGGGRQMEDLDRGLVSLRAGTGNHVSWRMLGTDPADVGFNLYRGATRVNASPLTNATSYTDSNAPAGATYTVRPVVDGVERAASAPSRNVAGNALDVPISAPPGDYHANDASVGDLDGDGQYEIVLKWEPGNARDNSQSGVTDNVYLDAYELDGRRLWRIDLGRNIRAGAHYTQFMVYDLDGDGGAEVAMKTADGTVSGTGQVIGDAGADHRNSSGYILSGPEFLTVFDGADGAILDTEAYVPARGNVSSWGDSYGNRVDRFLAGVAYLDGTRPSLIFSRGYYTRSVIVAWDFRDGQLTRRWTFDSNQAGSAWAGQGNHQLSIADADGDGRDEVMFGA